MSKRTYYRGPDAVVTDKHLVWRTTPERVFVIRELRDVGLIRVDGFRDADRSRPYIVHVVAGTLVLVVAMATVLPYRPAALALAGLAVAVPTLWATVRSRQRQRGRWELRATYRKTPVLLYASTDDRVFNQVVRGLRRAVEDARPPSDEYRLAVA